MSPLRLNLLGGFDARLGEAPVVLRRRKAQALLAYLAVQSGPHLRDKLAALLWGDATDARARHSLRQALVAIRQALRAHDGEVLRIGADGVGLIGASVEVDVAEFERLVTLETAGALAAACALYRGDLLEGLAVQETGFEDWLITQRERLRELAVEALARLLAVQVRDGPIAAACATAVQLLGLDPLQESVHRTLMRLHVRQGRRAVALHQYQVCVGVLQRELGVEPEPETRRLYQEILEGPGRGATPAATSAPPAPSAQGGVGLFTFGAEIPLIGRAAEVAALREACGHVQQGRGRIAVILGEAGTGKSRLAAHLANELAARRGRVLLGRAHDSEQILPFGPWIDALRSGRALVELAADTDAIWLAELARLFPELGPAARSATDEQGYGRLFEAMAQGIGRLAATRPLLLILEDVHWADEMTLRLLAFVYRRAAAWPLLLVATARSEDVIDAPQLRRVLHELRGEPGLLSLNLSPLTRSDTTTLVRAVGRAGTDDATVQRLGEQVWHVSEGNPFMIVETMRALSEQAGPGTGLRTPRRVRDVIAARLERLGEHPRQLAAVASVIGREFDFALLDRAAAIGTRAAAAAVEELVARRILHAVQERLDFAHERIREVAYAQLIAPRRKLLHATVAAAIEKLYCDDLEPHCVSLGTHWRKAAAWEKASVYLRQAGRTAARRSARRQAAECFEQALAALLRLPRRRDRAAEAIDLRLALRDSYVAVGELRPVVDHLREAEAAATALGDQLRLGWVFAYRTNAHLLLGENEQALQCGQRATGIGAALGDPKLRIAAHLHHALACQMVGRYRCAADLLRQSIASFERELTERGDTPAQQIYTRTAAALSLSELGEFAEGLDCGAAAVRIAEATGRSYGLAHACFGLGFLRLRQGDLDAALAAAERGLGLCRDVPLLAAALGCVLGYGFALGGQGARGLALLEQSVGKLSEVMLSDSLSLIFLGEAHLLSRRVADARTLAYRAIARTRERGERGYEAWALRLLGDAAGRNAPAEAEAAYRDALALADELGMVPLQAHCHLGRGRLRRRAGVHDRARADLSRAVDLLRAKAMARWRAVAEAELARVH